MFRFEQLDIWKIAVDYAKDCYKIADSFPKKENFALADQLRRASISISNNIAEGSAFSTAKFRNYLDISIGSTLETVNIINFAIEADYLDKNRKAKFYEEAEKIIRKIRSFKNSLSDK
jgi:four helix bundle protein